MNENRNSGNEILGNPIDNTPTLCYSKATIDRITTLTVKSTRPARLTASQGEWKLDQMAAPKPHPSCCRTEFVSMTVEQ
jgi:hypothetical protein